MVRLQRRTRQVRQQVVGTLELDIDASQPIALFAYTVMLFLPVRYKVEITFSFGAAYWTLSQSQVGAQLQYVVW
jgi:hypothetical protein